MNSKSFFSSIIISKTDHNIKYVIYILRSLFFLKYPIAGRILKHQINGLKLLPLEQF